MNKKLLIVEESLRDLKAHWFEYIKHIAMGASNLGWRTQVACHVEVEDDIKKDLECLPVFEHARYLDAAKRKWPLEHYYGFILHSIRTYRSIKHTIKNNQFDYVFCPTVTIHHLLAWYFLLKFYPENIKKLCLFFVTNPGVWDVTTNSAIYPKSTKILGYLLAKFKTYVQSGKVVMGVETKVAQKEFEHISGIEFQLFPHPVPFNLEQEQLVDRTLHFACYGFARYEKGSDLLQQAILQILDEQKDLNVRFSIQWTDDFDCPDGTECGVSDTLKNAAQVTIIDRAMNSEEYFDCLKQTDVMLLPYRNTSYYARVSRVAVEATNLGMPCVYTKGGWLEETISTYGSGIGIKDESVDDLVGAIKDMIEKVVHYKQLALKNKVKSIAYFEPANFSKMMFQNA